MTKSVQLTNVKKIHQENNYLILQDARKKVQHLRKKNSTLLK